MPGFFGKIFSFAILFGLCGTVVGQGVPVVAVPSQGMKAIANGFGYDPAENSTPYSGLIDETLRRSNAATQVRQVSAEAPTIAFSQEPDKVRPVPVGETDFRTQRNYSRPIKTEHISPAPPRTSPIRTTSYVAEEKSENTAEEDTERLSVSEPKPLERPARASLYDEDSEEDLYAFPKNADEEDSILNKRLGKEREKGGGGLLSRSSSSSSSSLMQAVSVGGTLFLVLGAFFLFVILLRKVGPKTGGGLPREALENVGRHALNQKLQLNLIRLGHRLILIAVTPDGCVETITEVDRPDEVAQILGMCRKGEPNSSTAQFQSVLDEFAKEKPQGGFFGANDSGNARRGSKQQPKQSLASLLSGGLTRENQTQGGNVYDG